MSKNTPPTFEFLDKFPTEIRSMIFGYMIRNIGVDQPDYGIPWPAHDVWDTQGLRVAEAKTHLTSSPWILLNKSYCAEYLQVFVKEVGLSASFTCDSAPPHSSPGSPSTHHPSFNVISPDAGSHTSSTTLPSRIKSISLSYEYRGSFFERGFGKTERRRFPYKGFLTSPLKLSRQYHDDYNIPAGRLFIRINYGDPTWTIMACINRMDYERRVFRPFFSLTPIEAAIHVKDYDDSTTAIDKKLENLKDDVRKILEKLRIKHPERHTQISQLEDMINRDVISLRRRHLRAIDKVTKLWRAHDIEEHPNATLGIPGQ